MPAGCDTGKDPGFGNWLDTYIKLCLKLLGSKTKYSKSTGGKSTKVDAKNEVYKLHLFRNLTSPVKQECKNFMMFTSLDTLTPRASRIFIFFLSIF